MGEKISYKPVYRVKRKTSPGSSLQQRLKSRKRYRKNKFKIKMYNRKWRNRNKMQLKRRNQRKKFRSTL